MAQIQRRLPSDPNFPLIASDWLTREVSPNMVFQEGKWWTRYHYDMWRRDLERDQRRSRRRSALKTFLDSQPNSWQ